MSTDPRQRARCGALVRAFRSSMRQSALTAAIVLSIALAACHGPSANAPELTADAGLMAPNVAIPTQVAPPAQIATPFYVYASPRNVIKNPGFESGSLAPGWFGCSGARGGQTGSISSTSPHTGSYDGFSGNASSSTPEYNGFSAVCQPITVPANAELTYFIRPVSNDPNASKVAQIVALYQAPPKNGYITTLFETDQNAPTWYQQSTSLSAYAKQKVMLVFGVISVGDAKRYIGFYVDDVSIRSRPARRRPNPR
jgi:hypothetical protein